MALGDVVTTVLDMTGRYDKETYIRSIVDSVIQKAAALKDHPQTLVESIFTVSNAALVHDLPLPANFRKVAYLRPASMFQFLMEIDPINGMVQGQEAVNVYYRTATTLKTRLAMGYQTTEIAFGYYAHPAPLVLDTDTNWVLDIHQDVIIDWCAAKVFRITGDARSAQAIEASPLNALSIEYLQDSSSANGQIV